MVGAETGLIPKEMALQRGASMRWSVYFGHV